MMITSPLSADAMIRALPSPKTPRNERCVFENILSPSSAAGLHRARERRRVDFEADRAGDDEPDVATVGAQFVAAVLRQRAAELDVTREAADRRFDRVDVACGDVATHGFGAQPAHAGTVDDDVAAEGADVDVGVVFDVGRA